MPTENLTEFFLYVIPGFIAFGIFKARYPRKDRDTFFEVTESIIVGIVILSVIKWIDGNLLNYFLGSNITGLPGIRYSLELILTSLITGLLMVGQVELRSFLARKLASFSLKNHPGQISGFSNTTTQKLHAIFQQERPV